MAISEFKFNWQELEKDIEKLDFSNYVGDSTDYVRVKIPDFAGNYNFHKDLLFPKKFVKPHEYRDVVTEYKNCNWIGAAKHFASLDHEKTSIFFNLIFKKLAWIESNLEFMPTNSFSYFFLEP